MAQHKNPNKDEHYYTIIDIVRKFYNKPRVSRKISMGEAFVILEEFSNIKMLDIGNDLYAKANKPFDPKHVIMMLQEDIDVLQDRVEELETKYEKRLK